MECLKITYLSSKKAADFMMLKIIAVAIMYLTSGAVSFAQIEIRGTVNDEQGSSIPGVTVLERGTTNGTITDSDGHFSIVVEDESSVIVFSSIGYISQEIAVGSNRSITLVLTEDIIGLEEVVVIGYGKQRKIDLTGSSVSLKAEEITRLPVLSAAQALQGQAAGVQIINSGAPGSAPNIRIRGTGSILGGVDPLYVVDGIITNDIRNINSSDINTLDILKDASSTAIYGARAANGVVLITTKSGNKGLQVSYDSYLGLKILQKKIDMAGPNLFTVYSNEAAGAPAIVPSDITGSANWYDELTRPAFMHNHSLALKGGMGNYNYYFSFGYLDEDGLLRGNNYKRYTLRYNNDITLFEKLKIGSTLAFSYYDSENKPYSLFTTAYIAAPIYDAINSDGSYGYTTKSDVGNPLATLEYTNDRSYGIRPQATVWAEYQIMDGMSFRTSFGIDAERNKGWNYSPEFQVGTTTQKNEVSDLTFRTDSIYQWVWDNVITYETELGEAQNIKVTAGHTAERRNGWQNRAERLGVENNPDLWVLNFSDTTGLQQNFRDPIGIYFRRESYFIRANYSLQDKYLINATYRRDANSNFSPENRWGNFPAVGLGWILSKENFLAGIDFLRLLKLRGSYGLVGNDVIMPGQFELRPSEYMYVYFGDNYINGTTVTSTIDPDLKWEVVKEYDIGLEFSLFDDKISGEIDYYHKTASGALYTVPLPSIGFGEHFLTNAADILNSGLEVSLRWNRTFTSDKYYSVRINGTINKNRVENIGLGRPLNYGSLNNGWTATQTLEGKPIGSFWVFKTDGIFQDQTELDAYPHVPNAKPGDFRLVDVYEDGIIDNKDRVHVGSYQPKATLGINQSLNWNNLDFSLDLYAVFGNKVYNGKKGVRYGGNYNIEYDVAMNRWQPGSGNNETPRAYNGVPYPSDYFIESGAYLKISDINLGYDLSSLFKEGLFGRFRVYFSSQNTWVFTKYSGFTPELPGNQNEAGIELNIYPVPASYVFGISLEL